MNRLFNIRHPFFLPLWRRVATTVFALGWALIELATGSVGWAVLFGAIGGYCAYEFFVVFDPQNYEENNG